MIVRSRTTRFIVNLLEWRRESTAGHPSYDFRMTTRITRREALTHVATTIGIASAFARTFVEGQTRRTTVNTVLGPIDTSKLGFTLSHEHIIASSAGVWQAWPELFGGRAKFIATASDSLKRAKDEEGGTPVHDCTTVELGRGL